MNTVSNSLATSIQITNVKPKTNFCNRTITVIKNIFSRLIELIKSLFSCCFQEIKVISKPTINKPLKMQRAQTDVGIHFDFIAKDVQLEVAKNLNGKDLLSLHRSSSVYKTLIETKMAKPLRKAQLEKQAFIHWKKILNNPINLSNNDFVFKTFSPTTRKFLPAYVDEISQECAELILKFNFEPNDLDKNLKALKQIKDILHMLQICMKKHPEVDKVENHITAFIENVISMAKPRNKYELIDNAVFHEVVDMATYLYSYINPRKAFDCYFQNLKGNRSFLEGEFVKNSYIETSIYIDIEETFKCINQLEDKDSKNKALNSFITNCQFHGDKALPFLKQISESADYANLGSFLKNSILLTFASIGEWNSNLFDSIEHNFFLRDIINHFSRKNPKKLEEFLDGISSILKSKGSIDNYHLQLAHAYSHCNVIKAREMFEKADPKNLNLPFNHPIIMQGNSYLFATLGDFKKAMEIIKPSDHSYHKIHHLLKLTNFTEDLEQREEIWSEIIVLNKLEVDPDEGFLNELKVVQQKIMHDPNLGKKAFSQFLAGRTPKQVFDELWLKRGPEFIKTYGTIEPDSALELVKQRKCNDIGNVNFYLALANPLKPFRKKEDYLAPEFRALPHH